MGEKRKSIDNNESTTKPPKKIILNRNIFTIDNDINKEKGKENTDDGNYNLQTAQKKDPVKMDALSPQEVN